MNFIYTKLLTGSKEIAQFISLTDGEWLCFTPEGYYNASPQGDRYLNVRIGNEVYGIDQYREALYKPDIVAARLSGGEVRLADAAAVIQNAAIRPPQVSILSPTEGGAVDRGTVVLSAAINGRERAIKSVRVLVNGLTVGGDELQAASGSKAGVQRIIPEYAVFDLHAPFGVERILVRASERPIPIAPEQYEPTPLTRESAAALRAAGEAAGGVTDGAGGGKALSVRPRGAAGQFTYSLLPRGQERVR
jgi:hypothetical protein